MSDNDCIVLYPSNWLYNASVVGFLRVLEEFDEIDEKFKFTSDGKVKIPVKIFIRGSNTLPISIKALIKHITKEEYFEKWLNKKDDKDGITNREKYRYEVRKHFKNEEEIGYRYIQTWGKFFGSKAPYQNLIQQKEWLEFRFIELIEDIVKNIDSKDLICGFCKRKNISQKWLEKERSLEKRITIMANPHTAELGASMGKFPNSFWNNKCSIFLCPLCVLMLIHHKISFVPFNGSEIFINAPDLRLSYDLNKFLNTFKEYKGYGIEKLLGSTFLQWAIKRKTLLGAWTIMNIEIIIRKKVEIAKNKWEIVVDYFDLPFHITKILLDSEIASLIDRIGEEKIFDLILEGKFSELEKANYHVLKTIFKLHNKENISDKDPITKYVSKGNYKRLDYLYKISKLIPELYVKILRLLEMEGTR